MLNLSNGNEVDLQNMNLASKTPFPHERLCIKTGFETKVTWLFVFIHYVDQNVLVRYFLYPFWLFTPMCIAFIFLVPSAAPTNLRCIHRDSRSILAEWNPIPEGSENGVLDGYNVEFWAKGNNQTAARETSNDEYTVVLDGLSYNTVYMIRVAAFTSSGPGEFSEPILVQTKMCK